MNTATRAMRQGFLLLLIAGPVFAAPPTEPLPPFTAADLGDPDSGPFYTRAVQAGLAEVEGGLLAQQRSKNPQVLAFATMVVRDHNVANQHLRELAATNRLDLPTSVTPRQAARKTRLAALSGDDFDRAYIEWQILAHKDAIELFRQESESGDDKDARQFASDTLPTLRMHLVKLLEIPPIPLPADGAPTGAAAPAGSPPAPAVPASPPPPAH